MSTLDKIESVVNLPFALKVLGVAVLVLTVWKGVHGFFPTFGIVAGAAMIFVGAEYSKLYK